MNRVVEQLQQGKTVINKEGGNSMLPRIKSRQPVEITPTTWKDVEPGDIVYCKVAGRFYTHYVKAKNEKRGCLIANASGFENGWTKNVYGKITNIL